MPQKIENMCNSLSSNLRKALTTLVMKLKQEEKLKWTKTNMIQIFKLKEQSK